jgi:TP901 family phage tail tape measure protein
MAGKSKFSLESILVLRDMATATFKNVQAGAQGFSRKMKKSFSDVGSHIKSLDKALNKGLKIAALAGAAAIGYGVKANIEYADSLAKISTIADTSAVSMESMRETLLGVSNRTGKAVKDIAEATYEAISAGVATADAAGFIETATKAAIAGFTDTATAVDALTTVLNAYGMKASEATRISDQLLTTQNLGKTTLGELGQYLGQVVPIASSLNVSTEELFSSLAALTMQGIKSSAAVTGMKAALSNIIKPSEGAEKMARRLGIRFDAMALKEKGLARFLDEVSRAAKGDTAVMAELFGSVEALNAVTVLTGKGAKSFTDAIAAMGSSVGATDTAFGKVSGTSGQKLMLALNKLRNVAIDLGDKLAPAVESVAAFLEKMGDRLGKLDFKAITGLVNAGLALVWVLLKLWPVILGLIVSLKVLTVITGVFNVTLAAGPVGLITLAITSLVVVIALLVTHWKDIVTWVKSAWESVKSFASGVWNTVIPYLTAFGQTLLKYFLTPVNLVIGAVVQLLSLFAKLPGKVGEPFRQAAKSVSGFQDKMNEMLTGTTGAFDYGGIWQGVGGGEKSERPAGYSNPATRVSESRSFSEKRTVHDFTLSAPRGWSIMRADGSKAPRLSTNLGDQ